MYDILYANLKREFQAESEKFNKYPSSKTLGVLRDLSIVLDFVEDANADKQESSIFTYDTAKKWAHGMINSVDNSVGPHWTIEQTTAVAKQKGIAFEHILDYHWWVTLNMIYSDYGATAKKYNVDNVDYYADIAKDWLFDEDSIPAEEKLGDYYTYIVKKD